MPGKKSEAFPDNNKHSGGHQFKANNELLVITSERRSSAEHCQLMSLAINGETDLNDNLNGNDTEVQAAINVNNGLLYKIDETPPWHLLLILAFQQLTTMLSSAIGITIILASVLCIPEDSPARAHLLSAILFTSGISSALQTYLGIRLPIIQGGTSAVLAPLYALKSLPEWQCSSTANSGDFNSTSESGTGNKTHLLIDDAWKDRMREIQGALLIASLFPILLSLSGAIRIFVRYMTPLVVAPIISLLALSLMHVSSNMSSQNWPIAIMTMVVLILFWQYMENVAIPFPAYNSRKGFHVVRMAWFKFFSILSTLAVMWLFCHVLTRYEVLPQDNGARTDGKVTIVHQTAWMNVPYPGQNGWPTISSATVFASVLAVVITMCIEIIGDYYLCARVCQVPPPPPHVISRGMFMEAISCILAATCGVSTAMVSYSGDIGAIGITKVASRSVILALSLLLVCTGIFTKLAAVFVTMPAPIVGGVLTITFSMVLAMGLSNIQSVNLALPRNAFIMGFSLFFGYAFPQWVMAHPDFINTGIPELDSSLTVILSMSILVGGLIAFILDNTIPGTPEERGLLNWNREMRSSRKDSAAAANVSSCYDLPFDTKRIRKLINCRRLWHFIQGAGSRKSNATQH